MVKRTLGPGANMIIIAATKYSPNLVGNSKTIVGV
jgi:hypothetical protein